MAWISDRAAVTLMQAARVLIGDMEENGHQVGDLRAAIDRNAAGIPDVLVVMPSWLTVDQVAELIGMTPRTVQRWLVDGVQVDGLQLMGTRSGPESAWRIDPRSVARLMSCRSLRHKVPAQRRPAA